MTKDEFNEDNFHNEDNIGMDEDNIGMDEENEPIRGNDVAKVVVPWEDGLNFVLGQKICSRDEVKVLVQAASHHNCFEYEINKSEPIRYVLRCAAHKEEGCKWYLRVLPIKDSNLWEVTTYRNMHTCSRQEASTKMKRKRGSAKIVASMLEKEFAGKLKTPKPKVLMEMAKTRFGMDSCYSTAWRGKELAANVVRGSPEESYQLLERYMYMLKETNAGTKTFVEWDNLDRFKYMFFALRACIEGFKAMRKVIIMDATHLKHSYGGVLIVAMAQDPNHHHYPIDFGVADGENEASWMWFMEKLKLVVKDRRKMMFISNRNKSLIKSVRTVFPLSQHGYCIYHLSQNVKGKVVGKLKETVASDFMICAQAYTEVEFLRLFSAFKRRYSTTVMYLEKSVKVEKWARCYFPGDRYNIVTTNSVESVNSVFLEAREYTLLPMIDMIILKIAEWFNKHQKAANEVPNAQKLVPRINDILENNIPIGKKLPTMELNNLTHEYIVIGEDGRNYVVNLSHLSCTCKCFDLDKYPCVHAIQAIIQLSAGMEVHHYEFASPLYLVKSWVKAYKSTIYHVPHMDTWIIPNEELQKFRFGYPPAHEVTNGPPQRTRYMSSGEHQGRRRRGSMYDYLRGEFNEPNPN